MKVRVLGCHGGELLRHRTTCFLIDGALAVDAGALCGTLSLEELLGVSDILLTHSHFDHVKDVPLMADVVCGSRPAPVVIRGPRQAMESLRGDIFNNRLWPDFSRIPSPQNPTLRLEELPANHPLSLNGYRITAVPVNHPVESVGYLIEGQGRAIAFSGDTGPTEALWKRLEEVPDLRAVFLELSFPSRMQPLADLSGHLTPGTLRAELAKLRQPAEVFLYHLKPAFVAEIKREVAALDLPRVRVLELGDEFQF